MSVRSFSVFQDSPAEDIKSTLSQTLSTPPTTTSALAASLDTAIVAPDCDRVLSPTLEKENIHPVTGSAAQASKKRKMSTSELGVLATKAVAVAGGSSGSGKAKRPELKQRKSSSSSVGKAKGKGLTRSKSILGTSSENVVSPPAGIPRRPTMPLSRSSSQLLATLPEEALMAPIPELPSPVVEQALIDSRCYELTVLPLADVSTAYLQSSPSEAKIVEETQTVDLEIRSVSEVSS